MPQLDYGGTHEVGPNNSMMNYSHATFKIKDNLANSNEIEDTSLFSFLLSNAPGLIPMVPEHWLKQDMLSYEAQVYVAMAFLIICLPANICQLLIFSAFGR